MGDLAESILPELKRNAIDVVLDPKTAYTVGGTTAAGGMSELLLNIPWPTIATAMGSLLSLGLFVIQAWRFVIDRRIRMVDRRIRLLEEKLLKQKTSGIYTGGKP